MDILNEISETYVKKNADYGNSFSDLYSEFGMTSSIIRLSDKLNRLKQLQKTDAKVTNESVRDTLMDLSNYAIMTIMELDKVGENE